MTVDQHLDAFDAREAIERAHRDLRVTPDEPAIDRIAQLHLRRLAIDQRDGGGVEQHRGRTPSNVAREICFEHQQEAAEAEPSRRELRGARCPATGRQVEQARLGRAQAGRWRGAQRNTHRHILERALADVLHHEGDRDRNAGGYLARCVERAAKLGRPEHDVEQPLGRSERATLGATLRARRGIGQ
jgi:hypothetical protein